MIKILCVSDEVDPLVYSKNVKERYRDVSFVIGAGDLRLKYYGFIVSSLNKSLYFVFGNHHLAHLRTFIKQHDDYISEDGYVFHTRNTFGSTCLCDKVIRDKKTGVLMMGLGGSYRYNKGEHQFTDFQMYVKMLKKVPILVYNKLRYGRFLDILVTHAPPKGIHDLEDPCHRGFSSFLWFMRVFKPKYLLHGHIHLIDMNQKREDMYQHTKVINVFKSYVLTIKDL